VREPLRFRRIKLRLTRAGMLYIAFTLTIGVVAVNSGNNLLFILVTALLSLLALSGLLAYHNIGGLAISLRTPEEIFAGSPATVTLELTNVKERFPSYLLTCADDEGGEVIVELFPGETAGLPIRTEFPERGHHDLPERVLTSEFPFGLVHRGGTFRPGGSCLVYPRPLAVAWSLFEGAERLGTEQRLPIAGIGGDYRGLREYLPGDSLSRVQWKGWLRHRRLLTKEFEAEGAAPVTFSYHAVPGPGVEERLGQLTWLVRTAFRRQRAVGLILPGRTFAPAADSRHRKTLLTALALFEGSNAGTTSHDSSQ
jgi:uncharacterized protein (DUF58 family)